jgi:hypothetical protein
MEIRRDMSSQNRLTTSNSFLKQEEKYQHLKLTGTNTKFTGFLTKRGGRIKNWKRRFFILENGKMKYYANEGDKKEKGTIIVANCECGPLLRSIDDKKNLFQIVNKNRTYYMSCDSSENLEKWKRYLLVNDGNWIDNTPSSRLRFPTKTSQGPAPPLEHRVFIGWMGAISRNDAELELANFPVGTFLVRWSHQSNAYVVSVKEFNAILHYTALKQLENGNFVLSTRSQVEYRSIMDFIAELKQQGSVGCSILQLKMTNQIPSDQSFITPRSMIAIREDEEDPE